jgi:hypothetical protein
MLFFGFSPLTVLSISSPCKQARTASQREEKLRDSGEKVVTVYGGLDGNR